MATFLIVGDPLDTLDYPNDTTVCLMKELHRRKHEVFYFDFLQFQRDAIAESKTTRLLSASGGSAQPFDWEKEGALKQNFDVLLHRKDPPVDTTFKKGCRALFDHFPKTLHINDPIRISQDSEKLITMDFPEYAIPTKIFRSAEAIIDELSGLSGEYVLKPDNLFSGRGIVFVSSSTDENFIEDHWKRYGPTLLLQPLIPEAESVGDLRVLCMNKKIIGSFLRKAKSGSRLQNLHQGGSAHRWELSSKQIEASQAISAALADRGLHLLGIDFLGDQVSEVNFTSPMGLVQINELYGVRSEELLADEIEHMLKEHR